MIGFLNGKIIQLKPAELLLDVNGVGYQISIPFSTHHAIAETESAALFIYTYVREDQIRLFGFYSPREKQIFEILLKVNGIGPSMALSILSGIDISEFINAVKSSRPEILVKIPGIGKTKAEKIIFELSRKDLFPDIEVPSQTSERTDAIEALVSLGYDNAKSVKAVDEAINKNPNCSVETIIRASLALLSGGR